MYFTSKKCGTLKQMPKSNALPQKFHIEIHNEISFHYETEIEIFKTLGHVVDRLCQTVCSLYVSYNRRITGRNLDI